MRYGTLLVAALVVIHAAPGTAADDVAALTLRASASASSATALTITVLRWPSDAERAPFLAALSTPPPAAAPAAAAPGGRGGRGGRGRGAAPASPAARLNAAVKAAPTVGYIWSSGVTGYSIKYAWRSPDDPIDRIVLMTDRVLTFQPSPAAPPAPETEVDFTILEIRMNARGAGEAKLSASPNVVVDKAAGTLALDGDAAAPALLRITR